MKIFCCGCNKDVEARLTSGAEIYPKRPKLTEKPFYKCDGCGNYVGCKHESAGRGVPSGTIATPQIRQVRQDLYKALEPLCGDFERRKAIYARLGKALKMKEYSTAKVNNLSQADQVMSVIKEISEGYYEN